MHASCTTSCLHPQRSLLHSLFCTRLLSVCVALVVFLQSFHKHTQESLSLVQHQPRALSPTRQASPCFTDKMKTSIATIISTLAIFTNAHLTYDASAKALKCPAAKGTYCYNTELIVSCADSVGTMSMCAAGTTCSQSSEDAGDAACAATSKGSSTSPIDDSNGLDCDCDEPPVSSKSWAPPLPPSSTPSSFSRFSNHSSTPVGPVIPSSTPCPETSSHYVPPQPPKSTPVGPAKVSSSMHYGTGTSGMPRPTSKVTTLNSSWKPTLTASSSVRTTSASPATQTTNAAMGLSANAVAAFGVAGLVAALL